MDLVDRKRRGLLFFFTDPLKFHLLFFIVMWSLRFVAYCYKRVVQCKKRFKKISIYVFPLDLLVFLFQTFHVRSCSTRFNVYLLI
jgi:hypothetical protein